VGLDIDSPEIPAYDQWKQRACNGHFASTCDHPLLLFNGEGDRSAATLRPGNVHRAEDWVRCLCPRSGGNSGRARTWSPWPMLPLPRRSSTKPDYWLLLAEGYLTRRLFGAIVQRLATLSRPAGSQRLCCG